MNPVARGIGPGLLYGLLAFLIGAVLGPIRELLLAPRIGGLPAALLEGVALAVLLWLAARLAGRGIPPGAPWQARAGMALAALFLVLVAEAALSVALDATGRAATRAPRGAAEQAVGLALLGWLVVLPFVVGRFPGRSSPGADGPDRIAGEQPAGPDATERDGLDRTAGDPADGRNAVTSGGRDPTVATQPVGEARRAGEVRPVGEGRPAGGARPAGEDRPGGASRDATDRAGPGPAPR